MDMENLYNEKDKSLFVFLELYTCANSYIESLTYINNTDKFSNEEKVELSIKKLNNYLKENYDLTLELSKMDISELRNLHSSALQDFQIHPL